MGSFWPRSFILLGFLLGIAAMPSAAAAAELRTDQVVTVGENEVIDDDLYAFGNTVSILGTVNGDVIAGGQTVTVAGKVGGSVFAAGSAVTVSGLVRGSVRAAGGSVTVTGQTGRDMMLAGGTVTVASTAKAQFDLYAAGGVVAIAAEVGRDLMLSGGDITLRGTTGRDVQADGDNLRLEETARVGGNLTFGGPQPPLVAPGATVRGQTFHNLRVAEEPGSARNQPSGPADALTDAVRGFVGMSLFTLLCVFGLSGITQRASERVQTAWLGSLGIGAAVMGATPFVAVLALGFGIIIGGWWLGPVLMLLLVPLALAGYATSAYTLGRWLGVKAGRPDLQRAWAALAGVAALTVLGALPVIGALAGIGAVLLGLGALVVALVKADSGTPLQPRLID